MEINTLLEGIKFHTLSQKQRTQNFVIKGRNTQLCHRLEIQLFITKTLNITSIEAWHSTFATEAWNSNYRIQLFVTEVRNSKFCHSCMEFNILQQTSMEFNILLLKHQIQCFVTEALFSILWHRSLATEEEAWSQYVSENNYQKHEVQHEASQNSLFYCGQMKSKFLRQTCIGIQHSDKKQ